MASFLLTTTRMTLSPSLVLASPSPSSRRTSLTSNFFSGDFSGMRRPALVRSSSDHPRRGVVSMVLPYARGKVREQAAPDLASHLYMNRIVYLGMPLFTVVTELIVGELMHLELENEEKPIHLYINSTGSAEGEARLGHEAEAFGIYDVMRMLEKFKESTWGSAGLLLTEVYVKHCSFVKPPIFTLCVGNAWGGASLLLAAGAKGHRAALPSSTIMMKQPIARFQGQASYVEAMSKDVRRVKDMLVRIYSEHTGKSPKEIEADMRLPKYFSPSEAVEYGIIDKVLYNERATEDKGVLADLKRTQI
ncbi:hypothetical protein OROHE_006883 [Orobanche hederae]